MNQKVSNKKEEKVFGGVDQSVKQKILEVTFAQIDKQYGNGAVMRLGESNHTKLEVIPTGSLLVDLAVGVGGLPRGRVIEIFGPEASGKTTLALQTIAEAQRRGGFCAFIDAEHAFDITYAARLGINTKDLIISQPDYGEQALDIAEMLVRSGAIDVIVIDSVAALVPKAELEGDMGDSHMGLQARLMSQALRKLTPVVHKSKTIIIFINQIRQNIGAMPFANKETTTGGNALKFYASIRLDVRRIESIKRKDVHVGNRVRIRVVKNKVSTPFKTAEVDLLFSEGINKQLDLLDIALQCGIVLQNGSWFSHQGDKFAQGRDQAMSVLKANQVLFDTIMNEVHASFQEKSFNAAISVNRDGEELIEEE
jgi:recombination protein RecA